MSKRKHEKTGDKPKERFGLTQEEYNAIEGDDIHEKATNFARMIMSPPKVVKSEEYFEDFENDYRDRK